jgi:hypothetical protein
MMIVLAAAVTACSGSVYEVTVTPSPHTAATPAAPTPAAATSSPTMIPTMTPEPTISPTTAVSFPPLETDASGAYTYPQVVADKTSAMTGEPVNFQIVTSENVNKIQTIIDGDKGKVYTEYEKSGSVRFWRVTIHFTVGGIRKVQFKCTMASGGTVLIPESPVKINVTFHYTAESTSKTITKGETVTFTLKTPDSIDCIYAVVDGVNQNVKFTEPVSDEGGIKTWKVNVTFFGLGERSVTFEAYDGSSLKATFPDPGIPIIVKES